MCSGGYVHVQSWPMVDILVCSGGQWWICSCAELVNGAYTHVQQWSMVDIFMCRAGQLWIYSCSVVVNFCCSL